MLASGRPIVVTADDNTELSNILEGIALIVPPGDAEGLAAAILAARRKDLSAEVKRGLTLAGAMRPQRVLSLFEARFSMRGRGRSASSTPRRRPSRLSRAALIAKCEGWG
jgi:glycosyltransferase involved in cell wall biosynthesis